MFGKVNCCRFAGSYWVTIENPYSTFYILHLGVRKSQGKEITVCIPEIRLFYLQLIYSCNFHIPGSQIRIMSSYISMYYEVGFQNLYLIGGLLSRTVYSKSWIKWHSCRELLNLSLNMDQNVDPKSNQVCVANHNA